MTAIEQPNTSPEATPNTEGQSAENPQTLVGSEPNETEQPTEAAETTTEETVEEPEQPEGPPENYEFKVPEGLPEGHSFDEAVMAEFGEVARELNLSQESAQKVVDKIVPKLFEQAQQRQTEQVEAWEKQARKHPELTGGDGLESNLRAANRAVDQFGTDGLKAFLRQSGLGNHPEIVAAFAKVGNALKSDGFVAGGPTARKPVNPSDTAAVARVMYPDGPKE